MKGKPCYRLNEIPSGMALCVIPTTTIENCQKMLSGIINRIQRRTGKVFRTRQLKKGVLVKRYV